MAARNLAEILIRAVDQTRGAFNSIRDNLRRLGSEAGRLGGILTGLGAGLSVASFAAMIKGSIDAADELNKLSQKIGISVEALSTLRFAAELSDVSLDTLQTGIKKLSQGITEASTGTGKAAEVFQALGISVTDANGAIVPTEKILFEVAQVFAGLEDGAVKSALAVELFGRSGLDLIPFLNQGADGIAQLTQEAERLGLKLTTETARAAEQFNDNLTALKFSTSTLGIALAGEMLPEL
ncbi:MAG: phage tail tape measure protein, partial [Gammaproteobacteria bacterium]